MQCPRPRSSQLEDLILCVQYRVLLWLDEAALCVLACGNSTLKEVADNGALWRRLALSRDRLAVCRFLGTTSLDASEPMSVEDPEPWRLQHQKGLDWKDLCKQLNPLTAEKLWPTSASTETSAALWTQLWDDFQGAESQIMDGARNDPASLSIFASQSPHLLWIGENKLLALAGGYSPEIIGGAELRPLREVYLLQLPDLCTEENNHPTSSESPVTTEPELRATRLDCGTANGKLLQGHPSMNGAACDFDPIRQVAIFFGGGAPHSNICNATSGLRIISPRSEGLDFQAAWEVISTNGTVEAGQVPCARQGLRGSVFEDEFVIFGGRALGGTCLNDVWSLDLTTVGTSSSFRANPSIWRQLQCDGTAPSPRVWYSACQAVKGQWFIFGGSMWQFEEPSAPHDYGELFILNLPERCWSSVDTSLSPSSPQWSLASALVPLGCSQLLLLGGTLPHRVGANGLNAETLQKWSEWYSRLDAPHVFDLAKGQWEERIAAVANDSGTDLESYVTDVYLRSHIAAVFVPPRRSVVVFGGSRYFTGEFFNDVLELQLPSVQKVRSTSRILGEGRRANSQTVICGKLKAPQSLPRHLRGSRRASDERVLTQGLLGRLRGMAQEGIISREDLQRVLIEN